VKLWKGAGLIASILFLLMGCGSKALKDDECVRKLSESIYVGVSQATAESALDHCGFTLSFDAKTDTIFAMKRGEKTGVTQQNWSVQVKLDDGHNVTFVKVEKVFTGP
jgi:hypothetical protein